MNQAGESFYKDLQMLAQPLDIIFYTFFAFLAGYNFWLKWDEIVPVKVILG